MAKAKRTTKRSTTKRSAAADGGRARGSAAPQAGEGAKAPASPHKKLAGKFSIGDRVKVTAGEYASTRGTVEEIHAGGAVTVRVHARLAIPVDPTYLSTEEQSRS